MFRELGMREDTAPRTWDDMKQLITRKPELMWTLVGDFNYNLAHYCTWHGHPEFLRFMLDLIQRVSNTEEEQRERRKAVFEHEDHNGNFPAHNVMDDNELFKFLIEECCSTGMDLLDFTDRNGWNFAHHAAFEDNEDLLEYVLLHSTKGISLLKEGNVQYLYPLDYAGETFEKYFNRVKVPEIELKRELDLVQRNCFFDRKSLISLMLGVIAQNIETQLYRNRI